MEVTTLLWVAQGVALIAMITTFVFAVRQRDIGWVDVGWSAGVGLVAILYAFGADGALWRRLLVGALAVSWSFRLAGYILGRVLRGEEDARYQSLRQRWGENTNRNAFVLFVAEALLVVLFSIPFLIVMHNPNPSLTGWDIVGVLIWIAAIAGETMADNQLQRFRTHPDNRTRTCREGLWRYSRHPNYFFEWVHWFAYAIMAVGVPYGHWAWLGPILMFLFLFKVTGIPFTEKQSLARRGEDYRRYQQTTSIFIPWFPKEENAS